VTSLPQTLEALPLMPLPSVLFPRVAIRLHVLEPAYQDMVERCQRSREPFGIVLISKMARRGATPRTHPVGCTANIQTVERLAGGRQKLIGIGGERFQIRTVARVNNRLMADVDLLPFEPAQPAELQLLSARLRPWVYRYIQILVRTAPARAISRSLPTDPVSLGYLAASVIDISTREKQHLLDTTDSEAFFRSLIFTYQREVKILQALLARGLDHVLGSFPLN
jgi:Lon protease-like protein